MVRASVSLPLLRSYAVLAACVAFAAAALAAEPAVSKGEKPVRRPHGIERRELWTTSNLQSSPDPPDPYTTQRVFPGVTFLEPLALEPLPGSDRLIVATRPGKIYSFPKRGDVRQADLVLDVGKTTYGLALDPNFAKTGYLYVAYILDPAGFSEEGSRLARFRIPPGSNPPQADPASEEIILTWPSGGHNGGCLRFGPDGMLYLATGDASPVGDEPFLSGQTINDLTGAILRIDVSRREAGRKYAIPPDNPFVGLQDARGEIWSFGHRQIWRFSFDPPHWHTRAGDPRAANLWAGEVGQDLWEMVYLIRRGGNYGWSVREGSHPFRPERPKGPGEFQEPIVEHSHADFRSITGGWVYRGQRLPELRGAYLYGDYDMGKIWLLRYDGNKVTEHRQLADTQIRIVDIGIDLDGEIYFVDFAGGGLHQLVPAPKQAAAKPFPQKLSETGLFASTKDHTPAKGVIPYSVNAPLWSDGAEKERFLAIPGQGQIEFDAVVYPERPPTAPPGWRFPDGTCLVKTFSLEMEPGNPASRKRLETRVLQHRRMPGNDDEYGNQVWYGYTYVWNDEQTDAELLAPEGLTRTYQIKDRSAAGGIRKQEWRFPSRSECTLCHTMAARYQLGVNTLQMNKDHDYGGVIANQLATLEHLGIFKEKLPKQPEELPRIVDYTDPSQDLNLRARSYLHANCSHCHRVWGGGNADFHILANLPLKETKALDARPQQGDLGIAGARIIAPGDPARSLILARMTRLGLGRMPHVASNVVDAQGARLIEEWIRSLQPGSADPSHGIVEPPQP
jgi:uncharacterized repeat protein (TIGR03806 family)